MVYNRWAPPESRMWQWFYRRWGPPEFLICQWFYSRWGIPEFLMWQWFTTDEGPQNLECDNGFTADEGRQNPEYDNGFTSDGVPQNPESENSFTDVEDPHNPEIVTKRWNSPKQANSHFRNDRKRIVFLFNLKNMSILILTVTKLRWFSKWARDFFSLPKRPHRVCSLPTPYSVDTGAISPLLNNWGINLITHPHLVPSSTLTGVIPPHLHPHDLHRDGTLYICILFNDSVSNSK
jgi:hypothetical protein